MKKIFPLILSLFISLMFSVSAEDAEFVFTVSESTVPVGETAYVTVSVNEHSGITGLALNVAYDRENVRFVSGEFCPSLPEGLVSVYDNNFGQVRITYVPSHGMTYFYGTIITLGFESIDENERTSVIRIDEGIASVTDRNYKPSEFISADGKAEFIFPAEESEFSAEESEQSDSSQ